MYNTCPASSVLDALDAPHARGAVEVEEGAAEAARLLLGHEVKVEGDFLSPLEKRAIAFEGPPRLHEPNARVSDHTWDSPVQEINRWRKIRVEYCAILELSVDHLKRLLHSPGLVLVALAVLSPKPCDGKSSLG